MKIKTHDIWLTFHFNRWYLKPRKIGVGFEIHLHFLFFSIEIYRHQVD